MKTALFLLGACAGWLHMAVADEPPAAPKPPIKLAADHFPAGQGTPEGVACDFERALINRDPTLYAGVCVKPFGGGENRKSYEDFLAGVTGNKDITIPAETLLRFRLEDGLTVQPAE